AELRADERGKADGPGLRARAEHAPGGPRRAGADRRGESAHRDLAVQRRAEGGVGGLACERLERPRARRLERDGHRRGAGGEEVHEQELARVERRGAVEQPGEEREPDLPEIAPDRATTATRSRDSPFSMRTSPPASARLGGERRAEQSVRPSAYMSNYLDAG